MKKNILVTNDDGYYAPGFLNLIEKLNDSNLFNLYVAAPIKQQSGVGHGITLFSSLNVHKIVLDRPSLVHIPAFGVDGTPADCTKVAITNLYKNIHFDLVVSGINDGVNVGVGVLYSGTVAAAFEANLNKIPSIALSQEFPKESLWHYEVAAVMALEFIENLDFAKLDPCMCININIPNLPLKEIKGFAPTKQGSSNYNEYYNELEDFGGRKRYQLEGKMQLSDSTMESDYFAVTQGYVSVGLLTPYMNHPKSDSLASWKIFK